MHFKNEAQDKIAKLINDKKDERYEVKRNKYLRKLKIHVQAIICIFRLKKCLKEKENMKA